MALIKNIGRSGRIQYGTGAVTEFRIVFPTKQLNNPSGLIYIKGVEYTLFQTTYVPTTGTLTIAGVTVTLTASDILSPAGVAKKIAGTAIAGHTVYAKDNRVFLTNTTVGSSTKATLALGTATNILFTEIVFTPGQAVRTGNLDDIWVQGGTPITLTLAYTGGTTPTISTSTGTEVEQAQGTLTYSAALTLTNGTVTVTAPINYVRVSNAGGSTQVNLYITR